MLAERARAAGIPVHAAAATLRRPQAARLLRRLLRARRFDVIHANEAHALTATWMAGAHRHAPVVVSRRVAFRLDASRLARARYRAARCIVAISNFVAKSVVDSGLPASAVRVVYDGVELPPPATGQSRALARQRLQLPAVDPLLGCVGYLLPEKGQESLLRAAFRMKSVPAFLIAACCWLAAMAPAVPAWSGWRTSSAFVLRCSLPVT